jgi:hypothetical protein
VFAPGKVIWLDLPQLSGLGGRRGITLLENVRGRLTQGNHLSRLVLLNLALACGKPLRNAQPEQGGLGLRSGPVRPVLLGQSGGLEQRAGGRKRPCRFPLQTANAPQRRRGRYPGKKIPRSARFEHDKKRKSTGGNPPSGHKKPDLPSLVLFSPRRTQQQRPSGTGSHREKQSWNCACI